MSEQREAVRKAKAWDLLYESTQISVDHFSRMQDAKAKGNAVMRLHTMDEVLALIKKAETQTEEG